MGLRSEVPDVDTRTMTFLDVLQSHNRARESSCALCERAAWTPTPSGELRCALHINDESSERFVEERSHRHVRAS